MTPEARCILDVFRSRGIRAGGMIHYIEFGDAIIWEGGFVRDAPVREALAWLFAGTYLVEHNAALELTEQGDREIYGESPVPRHGARVYRVGAKLLVKQTVLRGVPAEYVIDEQRERHDVLETDDAGIAAAVRDAVRGRL